MLGAGDFGERIRRRRTSPAGITAAAHTAAAADRKSRRESCG
jgi:hypothetical protein